MIYSNPEFIILLVLVVVGARVLGVAARQTLLLIGSLLFILWAGWMTTFVLLLVVGAIWLTTHLADRMFSYRKALVLACTALLSVNLFVWKYWVWVSLELGVESGSFTSFMAVQGLPIGISFYTLQAIAYLIDYNKGMVPARGFKSFLLFESFFGQLIAGPIVRYDELMPQLDLLRRADYSMLISGAELFSLGLFKKLVLGDRSAQIVDPIFAGHIGSNSPDVLMAALIFYTIQIYGDFSGYVDMGRGAARLCGIELPQNFNMPYWSHSIREFWRRWHITLGRWLRDYIYIPLGGGRSGVLRSVGNLLFTMLLCGIWHGADWNFIVWGMYHGILMSCERLWRLFGVEWVLPKVIAVPLTLIMVMFGWLLFRVEQLSDVMPFLMRMLEFDGTIHSVLLPASIIFLLFTIIIQWLQAHGVMRYLKTFSRFPALRGIIAGGMVSAAFALRGTEAPFIYFQF